MRKFSLMLMAVVLAVFFVAGSVWALPFNSNRPLNLPAGTLPNGYSEPSLQDIFNQNIRYGSVDAVNDQSNVALWTSSEADTDAYLVTMVKGDNGYLGIYSPLTGNGYMLLDDSSSKKIASFAINDAGELYIEGELKDSNFGNEFGFFWYNEDEDFYSYTEDDRNSSNGYGTDQNILALSYLIEEGLEVYTTAFGGKWLEAEGNNDWILAFEDLPGTYGDGDFNDAVFYVEDMDPVPEPASMLLVGTGLIGLAGLGRKKFLKKRNG